MWSDRKPWWQKKAGENEGKHCKDPAYARTWCVIKVMVRKNHDHNGWLSVEYVPMYKAVGRSNAPQYFDPARNKLKKAIEIDYLTKYEAIASAKGLNFLDGEII